MVGDCVDCCIRNLLSLLSKALQKSLVLLLSFFVRRPCCGLFFLFYLRTWVQQQQLESAAKLKSPREEQQLSERFRFAIPVSAAVSVSLSPLPFTLSSSSLAVGGVGFLVGFVVA